MRKWIAAGILMLALAGCTRYEPAEELPDIETSAAETEAPQADGTDPAGETQDAQVISLSSYPERERVKVKGIYVSAYVAGTGDMMDQIIDHIDQTELNAVVLDVKDDQGRITFAMDSPTVNEIGASKEYIRDMPALIKKLKEHNIYPIARVVAFRDPYLAEQKPEWSLHEADGSIYRDNKGLAWVNPYKKEVWDYLVEVAKKAGEMGFEEIQFDYIRFAVDKTMKNVVFDEADTQGRSKEEAITEFITYAYDELAKAGLMVSADVFGTIINSSGDAAAVGQDYGEMAKHLDYICPMIYPSHYGDGNFGIEHPDTQPYDTIFHALSGSRQVLEKAKADDPDSRQAVVRPWLQDFTASYLKNYIPYGDQQVRDQIQAVYDAGYDEWMLWDAGVSYSYGGLLTPEAAAEEEKQIQESRAALPSETSGGGQETAGGGQEATGGTPETAGGAQETADGTAETAGGAQETADGTAETAGGA